MDVSLPQTRIDLENVVDDTIVITGTFYKQVLPIFQEMMNSCSSRVQFDECMQMMINQHMKYIAAKSINSAYVTSTGIVFLGENKMSQ